MFVGLLTDENKSFVNLCIPISLAYQAHVLPKMRLAFQCPRHRWARICGLSGGAEQGGLNKPLVWLLRYVGMYSMIGMSDKFISLLKNWRAGSGQCGLFVVMWTCAQLSCISILSLTPPTQMLSADRLSACGCMWLLFLTGFLIDAFLSSSWMQTGTQGFIGMRADLHTSIVKQWGKRTPRLKISMAASLDSYLSCTTWQPLTVFIHADQHIMAPLVEGLVWITYACHKLGCIMFRAATFRKHVRTDCSGMLVQGCGIMSPSLLFSSMVCIISLASMIFTVNWIVIPLHRMRCRACVGHSSLRTLKLLVSRRCRSLSFLCYSDPLLFFRPCMMHWRRQPNCITLVAWWCKN